MCALALKTVAMYNVETVGVCPLFILVVSSVDVHVETLNGQKTCYFLALHRPEHQSHSLYRDQCINIKSRDNVNGLNQNCGCFCLTGTSHIEASRRAPRTRARVENTSRDYQSPDGISAAASAAAD